MVDKKKSLSKSGFLKAILSNLPGMVYFCRNDHRRTMKYVNEECLALTGFSPEELIGNSCIHCSELVHPEDRENVLESIQKALQIHKTFKITYRIIKKNGAVQWVWEQGNGIYRNNGSLTAIHGFVMNVTEQKENEECIIKSEKNLRTLMDALPVGVTYGTLDGKIEYCNRKHFELMGYTREEMPDSSEWRRLVFSDEEQRNSFPKLIPLMIKAREEGKTATPVIETVLTSKNGSKCNVEITGVAVDEKFLVIFNDITDRKKVDFDLRQEKAFLEAMVNSSPDGMLFVDKNQNVFLQNQKYIEMRKLPKELADNKDDEIRLRYIKNKLKYPDEFFDRVKWLYDHPNETGSDQIEEKDGTFTERHSSPVLDDKGDYIGRIWTFRDITDLKRYELFLENLSFTDGLTCIFNRRRFDEFLKQEWFRALRKRTPISLIMMDIDFFKKYNDSYGHLAGDECLRRIAEVIRSSVKRSVDLAARYGGEEFTCLLPDTDSAGAFHVASKIQKRLKTLNIPHNNSSVSPYVTLSMGIASTIPETGEEPQILIQKADELLYKAKNNGRNQIQVCFNDGSVRISKHKSIVI